LYNTPTVIGLLKLNRLTHCILIIPLKSLIREVFVAKWLKKFLFVKIQGAKEDLKYIGIR